MRYYDLDGNGKVRGHYANDQPGLTLTLLNDAPDDESQWNGSAWVPDQDKIDVREAEEARKAAKIQAMVDNLPSWAQVQNTINNISSLADAKAFLLKLSRVVYWMAKDKES